MLCHSFRLPFSIFLPTLAGLFLACPLVSPVRLLAADDKPPAYSDQEKPILEQLRGLRKLPDDVRAHTSKDLALQIRQLPVTPNKLRLAGGLANLSTEGDFGHDTLQEVANTLAAALREQPQPSQNGEPDSLYVELASLVRYEHVQVVTDAPQFSAAMAKLEADDVKRQLADFTLSDLQGKTWNLKDLRGKVVLVNFWATWCTPCRKEMPDLEALYSRFKDRNKEQGLVVLAISDEDAATVSPFIAERNITYPVLLDPGRKVNEEFHIEGIPKSFVYDRSGKLVAQSIDMRTQRQFLEMLAQAGLQ
jgi:peroxiredoxin